MLAALLRLRIKHSPLRALPFADRLARASTMPVRPGLDILVVVDRLAYFALPVAPQPVLAEMERYGHRTTVREVRGALDAARFHAWYLRYAHRNFDILVDGTRGRGLPILRLSSKPKIGRAALELLSEHALRDALDSMARACGYRAFLWRAERDWTLAASGGGADTTVMRVTLGR
jgi:hypothetical protein